MGSCQDDLSIPEDEIQPEFHIKEKSQKWLETLCSENFKGRKTGSAYDKMTFDYLCKTVKAIGYDYKVQEFTSYGGVASLRNLLVEVPGMIDSTIVIGSHFDGARLSYTGEHYPAANDNASGVVTNLALLDTLKQMMITPRYNIVCAFWDGEESFDGSWAQGSAHFVKTCDDTNRILFYLNLDSVGHDHGLYIRHRGHGTVEKALSTILSKERLVYTTVDMNKNRSGSSDYVSFAQADIPYLNFCDHRGDMCSFKSHSVYDVPEAVSIDRLITHIKNILDII